MIVLEKHSDGSETVQYEVGDRVRFVKDANGGGFLGAKKGECATVIRAARPDEKHPSIAFLDVQTDDMKKGGWGTIRTAPWDIEILQREG